MPPEITSVPAIHPPDVIVAPSPGRGRGVFARRRFAPGDIIEVCPMIVLPEGDAVKLDATGLTDYYFGWGSDGKQAAIGLGYGSLYNHSPTPNAEHRKNTADATMVIVACQEIMAGEEIFIPYQTSMQPEPPTVWFKVR